MKKKMYQQPQLRIVNLHCKQLMGGGSPTTTVKELKGNAELTGAGDGGAVIGGTGGARGRQFDCWGDDE